MNPDDPRHGTNAGYVAGCRDECCHTARRRQQKRRRLLNERGISAWASVEDVKQAVEPWRRMGFHDGSIINAARLANDHVFRYERCHVDTLRALQAVTEADFLPTATIPADLTRRRIFSLMAIGHPLVEMPIGDRGQWRYRERIRVQIARDVRDYYAAHEFKIGPSRQTASRARNAGHVPPMAWDDPGTLAWPGGTPPRKPILREAGDPRYSYDPVVVERFLGGEHRIKTSHVEKREIVRRWPGSHSQLQRLAGWKVERYIEREDVSA